MQLNIYLISHPIIQKLSNDIIYNQTFMNQNVYNHTYKQLSFLMMYEVLRQCIKIQNIYIKKINYIKETCIFSTQESYLILADLTDSYNIVTDIIALFPKVYIQHLYLDQQNNLKNHIEIYQKIQNTQKNNTKIILIQPYLNSYSSIKILDYLILKNDIKIQNIFLVCISCHHKIIEKIGTKYPKLSIYTSKIMIN